LFEKVFNVRFSYCGNVWEADFTAIGSVLDWACPRPSGLRRNLSFLYHLLLRRYKFSTLTALGSGFNKWEENQKIKFARKIDFKIVRGKHTENYLRKNNILKGEVKLGDFGLLIPYMIDARITKKYKLGVIPHYSDLNSPVVYDFYKKHAPNCVIINVQDDVWKIIRQIASCELIASSSLHGLIAADAFGIPNIWFENRLKYGGEWRFKYLDYYSIYGIENMKPFELIEMLDEDLSFIKLNYKIDYETVKKKQRELYNWGKIYFENLGCSKT
jgi:hypothetical protein